MKPTALAFAIALTGACANNALPPLGECPAPAAALGPTTEQVRIVPGPAGFDDLRYSTGLDRLIVVPQGTGSVFLLGSEEGTVTRVDGVPPGSSTADGGEGYVFVGDRGGDRIVVVDPGTAQMLVNVQLEHSIEYVRYSEETREVWVTQPAARQIEVLSFKDGSPPSLTHAAFISVAGGPGGLVFDKTRHRAYTHGANSIVAIDVVGRQLVAEWPTGCGRSHGMPAVDEARGLIFAGCASKGGGAVISANDGAQLAGYEAGLGTAVLGYSSFLGHFYLRSDPGTSLEVLAVCGNGGMARLGRVDVADSSPCLAADQRGNVWVCDTEAGGLIRFKDSYAKSR